MKKLCDTCYSVEFTSLIQVDQGILISRVARRKKRKIIGKRPELVSIDQVV